MSDQSQPMYRPQIRVLITISLHDVPPEGSERKSSVQLCKARSSKKKTSLMMKKERSTRSYHNFDDYIIMIETRMENLICPSTEDLDEDAVMDTNE